MLINATPAQQRRNKWGTMKTWFRIYIRKDISKVCMYELVLYGVLFELYSAEDMHLRMIRRPFY